MKAIIQSVKGTREFYPREMEIRHWLYKKIEEVASRFGYQEWDGPFLEKIDLYAAKSGEELVKEQSFVFPDRGGELITLRPELTPSLARMVAQKQNELVYPLRWWSFGPFWRYERPQKGRTREFFQWNTDLIGVESAEADAELVAVCASFFKATGITPKEVMIKVNHRELMNDELTKLGIQGEQTKLVIRLIDRRDKMDAAKWEATAYDYGLTADQLKGVIALLDNKNLWKQSDYMVRFFKALEALGVSEYVTYDPGIIRGLDYYTGIVFEAWDVGGDGRAVMGGGHYSNLIGDVGGAPLGGAGFAMGDVMADIVLEKYGKLPPSTSFNKTVLVTVFDESLMLDAIEFASALRAEGIKTICYPETAKLQKQFKYADRMGIEVCAVIGPDEKAQGNVTLKDLKSGTQQTVTKAEALKALRLRLA